MRHNRYPRISIITPCLNAEEYIERAVESVLYQDYTNFEHIIVDGGSTDGTLEILAKYSHLEVICESDDGLYDALNKGISTSEGDLVGWLNADDLYAEGAFWKTAKTAHEYPHSEMFCGDSMFFSETVCEEECRRYLQFTCANEFEKGRILHEAVLLNSCIFTKELLNRIGPFDDRLKISADRDYLIRLAASNVLAENIHSPIYLYRQHSGSLTFGQTDSIKYRMAIEGLEVAKSHLARSRLPKPTLTYVWNLFLDKSITLLKLQIKNRQALYILGTIVDCSRTEPRFPILLLKRLFRAIVRKIS